MGLSWAQLYTNGPLNIWLNWRGLCSLPMQIKRKPRQNFVHFYYIYIYTHTHTSFCYRYLSILQAALVSFKFYLSLAMSQLANIPPHGFYFNKIVVCIAFQFPVNFHQSLLNLQAIAIISLQGFLFVVFSNFFATMFPWCQRRGHAHTSAHTLL